MSGETYWTQCSGCSQWHEVGQPCPLHAATNSPPITFTLIRGESHDAVDRFAEAVREARRKRARFRSRP